MASNCSISGEQLSLYLAGELGADRAAILREHTKTCGRCSQLIARMSVAADALKQRMEEPLDQSMAATAWAAVERRLAGASEVLTLEEVAAYLRIGREELEQIVEELPVFTVRGRIRIQRERLVEWMRERERSYRRELMRTRAVESLRIALVKGAAS